MEHHFFEGLDVKSAKVAEITRGAAKGTMVRIL